MEFGDAVDHVAYRSDGAEGFVGDVDVEGFFDLEGDVDLVEGVDVEPFEGAGKRDGVGGDALRLGDDVNTAAGDVIHGVPTSLGLASTYRDARADVKVGVPSHAHLLAGENVQALRAEGLERGMADVHSKKALEEPGIALEGVEDAVAKEWRAIHQEQAAGHEAGKALDAAVGLLILGEVVGTESQG